MSSLHQRAKDLCLQALSTPDVDRNAFLESTCGEDVDLRHEVESLLAFHQEEEEEVTPGPGPETGQPRFAPGDVFAGRYRMITRLGRGGMGEVWRADDVVLEAPVALKLIPSAEADARD